MSGTERHTVEVTGPTRYRYELTDEQLEELRQSDHPLPQVVPVEWEPVGSSDEWSQHVETEK